MTAWASCLASLITAWRGRYGGAIPLIVGTFTYAQQRNFASYYTARALVFFARMTSFCAPSLEYDAVPAHG